MAKPTETRAKRTPSPPEGALGVRAFVARHPAVAATLASALLVALVYHAAPACGLVWDDIYLTTKNPYVQSAAGLRTLVTKDWWTASSLGESSAYYRPLVLLTFWLNRAIGGNTPASFHVGNVVLHVAAVGMLVAWLRRTLVDGSAWLTGVLALFFAVCGLNCEAVVWISGRCEPAGVCFALGALLANARGGRASVALAYALAFCAALCKEPFIVTPLLLLAHDVLVVGRDRKQVVARGAVSVLTIVAYFALRRSVGVPSGSAAAAVGVLGAARSFAFLVATMAPLTALPLHLDTAHLYRSPSALTLVAVYGAILAVSAWLARASLRRAPSARSARIAAFGWLVFLASLAPASLANADQGFTGERYFYFPLAGLLLMAGALLPRVLRPRVAALTIAALALVQAPLTASRVRDWMDDESLFRASVELDPLNGYALYALADSEARHGKYDPAEQDVLAARAAGWNDHHVDLTECFVYLHQKRHAKAEPACVRATQTNPRDPRAWLNLASEYVNSGKATDAEGAASNAIALKPGYAEAYFVRGLARSREGNVEGARSDFLHTLELNPQHPQAALALRKLDHTSDAPP